MGDMVEFDKNIGHNKISANFAYESVASGSGCIITINNTTTYQLVNIILANDTNPDGTTNVTGVRRLASEIPEQNVLNEFSEYIIIDLLNPFDFQYNLVGPNSLDIDHNKPIYIFYQAYL